MLLKNSETLSQAVQSVKLFIFGENNNRLEFLIENFYRLNHERRSLIIISSLISGAVLFAVTILLYVIGLFSLQERLSNAYSNTNTLKELKAPYMGVQNSFDELVSGLKSSNSNLSLVTVLEQKAKELGLQVSGFPTKPVLVKFSSRHPFSDQFQKVSVDFKITGVSLKKMMEYINTIEHMPNKLKVSKFNLLSITDAKLYFDVLLTVDGLIPIENQDH